MGLARPLAPLIEDLREPCLPSPTGLPTLSIIVPVRNGARVLPGCLHALRMQECPADAWEVIIVDDGSADETPALVEATAAEWAQQDNAPPLRLIRKGWQGAGAARNRGVAEARGELVLFTDADCEPMPNWVRAMIAPFMNPEVAVVAGGYLTRQTTPVARLAQAEFEQRYRLLGRQTTVDVAFTHAAAFRRTVFLDVGGFDERMPNDSDDIELSYRLAEIGYRIAFAPQGLVFHLHPETLGAYMRKKFGRGYWRTLVYKRYPRKAFRDSYTPQSLKLQIVLLCLAGISLPTALLGGPAWLAKLGMVSLGALAVTTLPFAFRLRGPFVLRLMAPVFLICQAAALSAGTLCGLFDRIERYQTGGRR